nr:hypothetical protein [Edaphobacter modestus]
MAQTRFDQDVAGVRSLESKVRFTDQPELKVSFSLTMATGVDDVTDQLLVDVFLGVAGEGSVANHSGSGRTPTCRSAASRKGASFSTTATTATSADIFCGDHLLCARLRSSNIDASAGSPEECRGS